MNRKIDGRVALVALRSGEAHRVHSPRFDNGELVWHSLETWPTWKMGSDTTAVPVDAVGSVVLSEWRPGAKRGAIVGAILVGLGGVIGAAADTGSGGYSDASAFFILGGFFSAGISTVLGGLIGANVEYPIEENCTSESIGSPPD